MKAATIHEIKQELSSLKPSELVDLCLRLGKFRKENKELLTYLLYEARDEDTYIQSIKDEITAEFADINRTNLYYTRKSLRKIARLVNKYCRYSGIRETELQVRLFFARTINDSGIPIHKSTVITNLYNAQLKKIKELLESLHEDLQYDYRKQLKELE
jgi:hypothetical protein